MKREYGRQGFTLIELLVLIALFVIFALIVLVAVAKSRERALDARIQNALGQIRYQAEIVYDSQGASYQNWSQAPTIQNHLTILLEEIDKNYGDAPGAPYVTLVRDSQHNRYCISAPAVIDSGQYYCVDTSGVLRTVSSACPNEPSDGNPLHCPSS